MKKLFCFAIANIPNPLTHPKKAKAAVAWIKENLPELKAVHSMYPQGTLLFFETLNDAKTARNRVRASGNDTGNYIMNAEAKDDMSGVTITTPAEE